MHVVGHKPMVPPLDISPSAFILLRDGLVGTWKGTWWEPMFVPTFCNFLGVSQSCDYEGLSVIAVVAGC